MGQAFTPALCPGTVLSKNLSKYFFRVMHAFIEGANLCSGGSIVPGEQVFVVTVVLHFISSLVISRNPYAIRVS